MHTSLIATARRGICTLAGLLMLITAALPARAGLLDALVSAKPSGAVPSNLPRYPFGSDAKTHVAQYVDGSRTSNIQDVKKIGIVNFSVEFTLAKSVSAAGWGGVRRSAVETDSVEVPTPDPALLQSIVDQVYLQVQNDFKTMGIEVVPFDVIKATPSYPDLAPAQHASPWLTETKDSVSLFVAPTGMPLYMDNPKRADFLKGLGMSFGTNTRLKEVMMTFDLKREVHLLSVNMVVDTSTLTGEGGRFTKAAVTKSYVHHLHAGNTLYRFIGPGQPQLIELKLKQPLASDKSLVTILAQEVSKESSTDLTQPTTTTTTTTTTERWDMTTYYDRSRDLLLVARELFALELAKAR